MSSIYKSFAVIGAGGVGLPIVDALAEKNVSVLVVSRPSSGDKNLPAGVRVAKVEFDDVSAVATVLKEHNVEVVVSAVNRAGLEAQPKLADAAKQAGVKLFAPSEFGVPTGGHTEGFLGAKSQFADYLSLIGLPSARFYTGAFMTYIPRLTALDQSGKFNIIGKGTTPASFTAIEDIGGFVAHVLTTLPPSGLDNAVFRIEGERATLLEIAALYGNKVTVAHVDTVPGSLHATILLEILEAGYGSVRWEPTLNKEGAEPSNKLWEGHHWKTIKEIFNL